MNKIYETTVSTHETIGSAGPWYLKGEINEGSPLTVPPSHLEAIPDNTEREGVQGKSKSLCVEKTEIKVLEVLEFSKQCPGEEEAIQKKKSKQTNKKSHHKGAFESLAEFRSTRAQGEAVHRLCEEQLSQ